MRIGARTNIQDLCCLHVTNGRWPLLVEEEVSIAHNVMLHGCTIRKGALVGMSTTIMDGAEVGEGCLVAAGSLLKEGFKAPPHTLVAGLAGQGEGRPLAGAAGPGGRRLAPLRPLQGGLLQGRLGHGGRRPRRPSRNLASGTGTLSLDATPGAVRRFLLARRAGSAARLSF